MLPSSGYFRGIPCPAHTQGTCSRPYCHFGHNVKVFAERNVASSSQASMPTPSQENAEAGEEEKREILEDQDMRKGLPEYSRASASLSTATTSLPEPVVQEQHQPEDQQQTEPHSSQAGAAPDNVPKPELLHQLMSEALKKVLAENPTLASTVDASAIRIGIDPISQGSPEGNKSKKQYYPRPPGTPSYNPTPIKELKMRKMSVDGESSHMYNPTKTALTKEAKGNDEDEEGGETAEFSSSGSEEVEEKHDDFDLLEEVLAEHSKNNKVKVKKKRVKELGKLQYSLSKAEKKTVDNKVMIADAKKLTDKEVKRYEVSQPESVNKVITDGPYFLPPSPVFTSSSDGFEAFNSRASYQEEEEEKDKEKSIPDKTADKSMPHTEPTKANTEPISEKNTTQKSSQEASKSSSQPISEKTIKASGHTHLPKLLPTLDAPKLSRPNVRNWIPLVRNSMPTAADPQKNNDQLDEMLKIMDGNDASNKRKTKENDNQTASQKDSENRRPRKKYKVDLNKEIESLTNPTVDEVRDTVTPEQESANDHSDTNDMQNGDKKQSTKETDEAEEKQTSKKTTQEDQEDKENSRKDKAESQSLNSDDGDSSTEESEEDSKHRRARHKKKRKRSRSSSSHSDYSRHRRKKRKKSHRRHHKKNKRSRKRRDSTSSLSDHSKESEEEKEDEEEETEEEDELDEEEEEEENKKETEEEEEEEDDKDNEGKENSESDDQDESNDEVDHHKKSKRHRKKHKHYKKSKHKRNRRRGRRKRKSKSYSRSRSSSGSRDSSRSRSRSRSSSKHRKKKSRRRKSRNATDSEERDSDKDRSRSRSRSSSRSSSKVRRSRESKEKNSNSSKPREPSKSKDDQLEEERKRSTKGDRKSRDRSTSKSRQVTANEETSNSHNQGETSILMPVDPTKIKQENNASDSLIPDLSKVKVEKEEQPTPERSSAQVNTVNVKSSDKSTEDKTRVKSEAGKSKTMEKVHERRRFSTEEKSRRRHSHERKDSTESTSDKGPQRQVSCESKTNDTEPLQPRKKTEERRLSDDKNKTTPSISSQPTEMSMFDLVLASTTKKPKNKTLTEISIFDNINNTSTNEDEEEEMEGKSVQSDSKKKSKEASHKSLGDTSTRTSNSHHSEAKSSSSNRPHKSSRSEKPPHTDTHHKHDKSDKSSHSSSKTKSSNSSHHHHNSTSSNSTTTHRRSSSTSSRGNISKHHSTTTNTSTTAATTNTSSSKHTESSSSSRNKKSSESSSSRSEKEREKSRHSSTSSSTRKHSSSSSKHHNSTSSSSNNRRSSSIVSKQKDDKNSVSGLAKARESRETAKKRKVSTEGDSTCELSDDDDFSIGGDSPMPDLSVLDEIPQDDWEQMLSSTNTFSITQEHLEDSADEELDHDDPGVLEECMKMFKEFQPEENPLENQVLPKKIKAPTEESKEPAASASSKSRVARSSSTGNLIARKPSSARHQRNNPMQRMVERYQKLKEELKLKEQQLHHLQGSSSVVSSSSNSRTSIAAASSSTHHINPAHSSSSSSSGKTKKRVAHVPNVSSLLHPQGKIQNHSSSRNKISPRVAKASGVIPETTPHTVAKGGKRVAHTPRTGALARPIIQPELGSLVPQNIRQRYLNALIEECKKFSSSEREAFNIAAAEERVCYQRTPSRMVYLNLVVNAVKRLRTQQQAGEAAQELLDQDPQLAEKMCIEEPSSSPCKPSSSPSLSLSSSPNRPHPINPNHVQLSHKTVLTSGGYKGSWSIEKPKKMSNSFDEALKGETFYKNLLKYVLTEEQLGENGFPCPDPEEKGKAVVKKVDTRKKISPSALERYCDRCSALYNVDKWGFPKSSAPCVYHWGRAYKKRKYGTFETTYSCCGGEQGSGGCSQATTHVSQNYNPKHLRGYVRTISKDISSSNKEVYALDCEMCYTTEGNELTRITVIGCDGNVVYEQLVKPENPILDYNTRFSGITESDMEEVKLTIRDVQAALLARFSDKTILIGHSLESDLHALKVIHNTVVDTSVVFPHKMGAPYKRALKNLAAEYLKRIIQDDVSGHDSAEDAVACLHLMQWKVKEDLKGFSK